jgi:hypothetical protein
MVPQVRTCVLVCMHILCECVRPATGMCACVCLCVHACTFCVRVCTLCHRCVNLCVYVFGLLHQPWPHDVIVNYL